MLTIILFFLVPLVASAGLTLLLRNYAVRQCLLDIPNERSSHTMPTPRGGGLAIVIVFLTGILGLYALGLCSLNIFLAFFVAGLWVAVVGFIDDHGHIPARWRLLAHFAAVIWGLFWLAGFPAIFPATIPFWIGDIIGAIFLVWLLNLYNFMDGIDGLASVEAVSTCLGAVLLMVLTGSDQSGQHLLPVLLMASVAGFLVWNFPPAKIFMGDAGSGFLGLVSGFLAILNPEFFWCWMILLAVFIVDASFTLIRRYQLGENIFDAHRSHAYQIASRRFQSHKRVTLAVAAINIFWLLPIAVLVALYGLNAVIGVIIAYSPLVALAVYFKAGVKEC
jgi:Fuc2NAc and GlcNAc transferase